MLITHDTNLYIRSFSLLVLFFIPVIILKCCCKRNFYWLGKSKTSGTALAQGKTMEVILSSPAAHTFLLVLLSVYEEKKETLHYCFLFLS